MTTRSFWIILSVIGFLAVTGLAALNQSLLALALPLIFYLFVAALNAPGKLDLSASRHMSTDRITQGSQVKVEFKVKNESGEIDELHLSETARINLLNFKGNVSMAARLEQGDSIEYAYSFQAVRGAYDFPGLLASALEPFGLFESQETLPTKGNLLVYPLFSTLNSIPIRPPQTKGFLGPISARRSGAGMEFFGVRNFHLGDSLRHINWKTSARYPGNLFTNEYEQEQIADVGLILDARKNSDIFYAGVRLFEYSVQATASLAEILLKDGHRVSLLVNSSHITRVFPGYGKVQLDKLLENLSYVDTGQNAALEYFQYFPPRLLPPRGQLIYISPLDYTDMGNLTRLRALGYAVMVVSPNPINFEIQNLPASPHPDYVLARRLAQIERNVLINSLQGAGIPVADWNVEQPLSQVVKQVGIQSSQLQRMARILR